MNVVMMITSAFAMIAMFAGLGYILEKEAGAIYGIVAGLLVILLATTVMTVTDESKNKTPCVDLKNTSTR